jgi:hypothetical protein
MAAANLEIWELGLAAVEEERGQRKRFLERGFSFQSLSLFHNIHIIH